VDVDEVVRPSSLFARVRRATWSMMASIRSVGMVGKDITSGFCLVSDGERVKFSTFTGTPNLTENSCLKKKRYVIQR